MHSTSNLEDDYIGSGKRLWLSVRKHGRENHSKEILEFFDTRKELKKREREIVNEQFITDPMCMNLGVGGEGGFINKEAARAGGLGKKGIATPQATNKMKELWKNDIFKRELMQKIGDSHFQKTGSRNGKKGSKQSKEWKSKISKINSIRCKGKGNPSFGTFWIFKDGVNKKIMKDDFVEFEINGWKRGRVGIGNGTNRKGNGRGNHGSVGEWKSG